MKNENLSYVDNKCKELSELLFIAFIENNQEISIQNALEELQLAIHKFQEKIS